MLYTTFDKVLLKHIRNIYLYLAIFLNVVKKINNIFIKCLTKKRC